MGATEIADVVSAYGKTVLNIQDLRRKYGTQTVGHKQARALHKLAHLLHTDQPVDKLTSTQLTQHTSSSMAYATLQLRTDH
jgi:hypothetical protein